MTCLCFGVVYGVDHVEPRQIPLPERALHLLGADEGWQVSVLHDQGACA